MNPSTTLDILLSLLGAFLFCILVSPAFATSIAETLLRHAEATRAAYVAYRSTWNRV
jgi:hypothetical protein